MQLKPLEQPKIELQFGGPATADEVFDALVEIQEAHNQLLAYTQALEKKLESCVIYLADRHESGSWQGTIERIYKILERREND